MPQRVGHVCLDNLEKSHQNANDNAKVFTICGQENERISPIFPQMAAKM